MREFGTDLERSFRRSSHQSVAPQAVESSGIDPADASRRSPSSSSTSASRRSAISAHPGNPGPTSRAAERAPTTPRSLRPASVSGVPETCPRTSKSTTTSRRRSSRDLGLALRRSNSENVPTMSSISESSSGDTTCSATPPWKHSLRVSNTNLLAVDGGHGDHFDGAFPSGIHQAAKRVEPVFGGGVRPVNDQNALRCTQFGQKRRERAVQPCLENDGELSGLAQVDAQGLQAVLIGVARSGEVQHRKRTLAYTGPPRLRKRLVKCVVP